MTHHHCRLQFMGEVEYSLSRRSFHVTLLRGLSPAELDKACVDLHRTLAMAESLEAEKVIMLGYDGTSVYYVFSTVVRYHSRNGEDDVYIESYVKLET